MGILFKNALFLFLFGLISSYSPIHAQNMEITDYLKNAGYYARIYNGLIEQGYNRQLYENNPYYHSDEFTDGEILYKNNIYPNQKVRIDLFLEKLIVLVPENFYKVAVNSEDVGKVIMYNKTFLWLEPAQQSGLKPGFYISLYEGKKIKLFCKQKHAPYQKVVDNKMVYYFDHYTRYYVLIDNKYHTVKNTKSFVKLFPRYKKEINRFAKDNSLDFDMNKDHSLSLLSEFCEQLPTLNQSR